MVPAEGAGNKIGNNLIELDRGPATRAALLRPSCCTCMHFKWPLILLLPCTAWEWIYKFAGSPLMACVLKTALLTPSATLRLKNKNAAQHKLNNFNEQRVV